MQTKFARFRQKSSDYYKLDPPKDFEKSTRLATLFNLRHTLMVLAKFGGAPQQTMSVKTQKNGFIHEHQDFLSFFVLFTPKKWSLVR